MGGCSCSISTGYGEGPSCSTVKIRTARKEHRCWECGRVIQKKEKYEYLSGIWDGDPAAYKTCMDCKSVIDQFFSAGVTIGSVWEEIREDINTGWNVPEKCLAGLTPAAREKVCEMIEESWMG